MKHLLPNFFVSSRLFRKTLKAAYLIAVSFWLFCPSGRAQEFDWVINFGDTSSNVTLGHGNGNTQVISDAAGNVYVTGVFCKRVDFDPGIGTEIFEGQADWPHSRQLTDHFLSKYDSGGKYLWTKQFISTAQHYKPDLALDSNGYIYISIPFLGKVSFDTPSGRDTLESSNEGRHNNTLFMKYDTAGNLIWANMLQAVTPQSSRQPLVWPEIGVNSDGSVYLAGMYSGSIDFDPGPNTEVLTASTLEQNSRRQLFLAKYDTDGNFLWVKDIKGVGEIDTSLTGQRLVLDLLISKAGDLYITGYNYGNADFDPGPDTSILAPDIYRNASFLAKYDSNGNYLWAKIGGSGDLLSDVGGALLAEDDFGNIYTIGDLIATKDFDPGIGTALISPIGDRDVCVAKYDPNGEYIWAKNVVSGAALISQAAGLALSRSGNIYLTGYIHGLHADVNPCLANSVFLNAGGGGTPFLLQLDASGNYLWAGNAERVTTYAYGDGNGLALDPEGNVFLTGRFAHTLDFDPSLNGNTTTRAKSPSSVDWYVWKLRFNDTAALPVVTIQECDSFVLNEVIYTSSGRYSQYIPSVDGCTDSTIVFDLVIGNIEQPIITVDGFVLGVHKPYNTYQWLKGGVLLPGETHRELLVTENGDYQVIVTGGQDCRDTSAIYRVNNTMIDDISGRSSSVKVYPNPVYDVVQIQSSIPVNILLTDIAGRKMLALQNVREVDMKGLPTGVYVLQIKSKEGMQLKTVKLVKK